MAPTSRADGKRFSPRFRSSRSTHPVKQRTACCHHLLRIHSASFLDSMSLQDCCSCAVRAFPQAWEETSAPDTHPPTAPAGPSLTIAFHCFTIHAGFPFVKARSAPLVVRAPIAGASCRDSAPFVCAGIFGYVALRRSNLQKGETLPLCAGSSYANGQDAWMLPNFKAFP